MQNLATDRFQNKKGASKKKNHLQKNGDKHLNKKKKKKLDFLFCLKERRIAENPAKLPGPSLAFSASASARAEGSKPPPKASL